ncbi:MAG: acyl-CoA thioesterase [Candidatus Obscuribacterales bacterium]|nr:acyl-CoA thioesterase [Candidatus Obscuribacterales bacterium]
MRESRLSLGDKVMRALYIEHDINVSTYDIDFAGHVSNTVYLRWLEDMRLKMFDIFCPLQQFLENGQSPILLSTEIQYKRAIKLFDKPKGKMWLSDLSLSTLTIEAEIFLSESLCTRAKHVGVFVDIARMKPIRIPKVFHEAVKSYLSTESV